jgi:hypothetical protein
LYTAINSGAMRAFNPCAPKAPMATASSAARAPSARNSLAVAGMVSAFIIDHRIALHGYDAFCGVLLHGAIANAWPGCFVAE